jgi:hypothetical protein
MDKNNVSKQLMLTGTILAAVIMGTVSAIVVNSHTFLADTSELVGVKSFLTQPNKQQHFLEFKLY